MLLDLKNLAHFPPRCGRGYPQIAGDTLSNEWGTAKDQQINVLRMEFSIVKNLSGLRAGIFGIFRSPQLKSCVSFSIFA